MGRRWGALVCSALWAVLAPSCRAPTEITVVLSADFPCADLRGTALIAGRLQELETKPSALVTPACLGGPTVSQVGSVVLVPSGSKSDEVAFKVVAGFGRPVDDCLTNFGPGCIVARRALRYLPHTPLLLPVLLSSDCNGILCGKTETCSHGQCVPAEIDPSACAVPGGCPEVSDGGSVVDADASSPDAPPPDPSLVAHYPLTACDSHDIVGGATGTPFGSISAVAGYDNTPGAACFFSPGSYIDIASPASATPQYSVAVWTKPDRANLTYFSSIVSRRENNGIYGYNLFVLPSGSNFHWEVYHAPLVNNTAGGNPWSGVAYDQVADDLWHHVAFTYDGTNLVLYVDGVEQSRAATTYKYLPETLVTIASVGGTGGHGYPFPGAVEEVRIYSRALTAIEISTLAGR